MFYRVVEREPNGLNERQISGWNNASGVYRRLTSAKNARAQLRPNPRRWHYYGNADPEFNNPPTRHVAVQRLYVANGEFVWRDVDVRID